MTRLPFLLAGAFVVPAFLLFVGCAPKPQADPLLVAYDLANEVADQLDVASRQHEARTLADLGRRFAQCREAFDSDDPRPCFRAQAGMVRQESIGEAMLLDHLVALHRDALGKLREARSCREAAQRCEGPAREAADSILARIRGDLRSIEARHTSDAATGESGVAQ